MTNITPFRITLNSWGTTYERHKHDTKRNAFNVPKGQEGDGAIQPAILENGEAYRRAGEGLRI